MKLCCTASTTTTFITFSQNPLNMYLSVLISSAQTNPLIQGRIGHLAILANARGAGPFCLMWVSQII